jgi:phosphoribosylaminoimidazolecarboxamide formyltransferase/IMP cyclohydrolase
VPDLVPIKRALLSVSDKTDLVPFARGLAELGVELISTGGTAVVLREAGLDVISVDQITGFPEMMDGRVKTLHPAIHGALLGRRDMPTHLEAMKTHDIAPIDLVCVNLYPFEQTILAEGVSEPEAIEQIDIGGPAILRSSAKNHDFVTVVTSARQYDLVVNELREHEGATTLALRRELSAAAFARTAEYDAAISAWMGSRVGSQLGGDGGGVFPEMLQLSYGKVGMLRYGENPHQKAAVYADPSSSGPSLVTAHLEHGKPLSYNNLNDGAAALELVQDLHDAFADSAVAAIVKHTNACGAAVAADAADVVSAAMACDPKAAYGGILCVNEVVDAAVASRLVAEASFLEVVIAPSFTDDAQALVGERWQNIRLLATGPLEAGGSQSIAINGLPGGLLLQERDVKPANPSSWARAAGPDPDANVLAEAAFAWTVVKHLKSNAISITAGQRLLGAGPGQVDRVGACGIAIEKAGDAIAAAKQAGEPIVAASDAFFPFADGPEKLIDAGVQCIVQPGASRRDQETFDLCESRGVTCLVTHVRHFRH